MIGRAFLYIGALGGWLGWLLLWHVWRFTSTDYVAWLLVP